MRIVFVSVLTLAAVAGAPGCTWVKPTEAGAKVTVAQEFNVTGCRRLGTTTTTVKANVGAFQRNEEKVANELQLLAQDEAAKMGGDTIVPEGGVSEGSRSYGVYRCRAD